MAKFPRRYLDVDGVIAELKAEIEDLKKSTFGPPNYSTSYKEAITTPYTATKNGWVYIKNEHLSATQPIVKINGIEVGSGESVSVYPPAFRGARMLPVSKDDVVTWTGSTNAAYFFPCKS